MRSATTSAVKDLAEDLRGNSHQVFHFAAHGHQETRAGLYTLAFHEADGAPVEPNVLAKVIADGCKREDGESSGSIECVVLNACRSSEIAERLKSDDNSVPWVFGWTTNVDDDAARAAHHSIVM